MLLEIWCMYYVYITYIPSRSLFAVKNANKKTLARFHYPQKKRTQSRQKIILWKCFDSFFPKTTQPFSSYVSSCQLLDFFPRRKRSMCVSGSGFDGDGCDQLGVLPQFATHYLEIDSGRSRSTRWTTVTWVFETKNHHIPRLGTSGERWVYSDVRMCFIYRFLIPSDSWLVNIPLSETRGLTRR